MGPPFNQVAAPLVRDLAPTPWLHSHERGLGMREDGVVCVTHPSVPARTVVGPQPVRGRSPAARNSPNFAKFAKYFKSLGGKSATILATKATLMMPGLGGGMVGGL